MREDTAAPNHANLPGSQADAKAGCVRLSLAGATLDRSPTAALTEILDPVRSVSARSEMRSWPGYAPTPLVELPGLAEQLGVSCVWCKDESGRFGIGSFKALGGAYAVLRALQGVIFHRAGEEPSADALVAKEVPDVAKITTVTASAGNHGRAVAWGSERFGCRCLVVLPEGTGAMRADAIASHGAEVEWYPGDYDEAVRHAERLAAERGWLVVSDTAYAGYEDIPRRVSEGYTLSADEMLEGLRARADRSLTHLFIQAGVGGLATGVCGHLWHELGPARPTFIAVEPLEADCFGRSIRAGDRRCVPGPFETHMGGLAAGVPSTLAWRMLSGCLDAGIAISDEASDEAAFELENGSLGSTISAGPSGAAGVGALLMLARLPSARRLLGLDSSSALAVVVTEQGAP